MGAYKQSVGLLGGSFDPVHNGHLSIARSFVESSYISDLWLLLTPESPHKTQQEFTEYELRFEMLSRAFKDDDNIVVSDVEKRLSPPYYTLQTLQHVTAQHPDTKFYLCMGEDSLVHFHTWYKWREILSCCELLVARRPSFQPETLDPEISNKTHYVVHEPVDISSTEIRKKVQNGADITDLVPSPAADIINREKLYRNKS